MAKKKKHSQNFHPESVGDYPVGYGVPPAEMKYRKGCASPNPSGRPRKKHLLASEIGPSVLGEMITVTEGTKRRKMSKMEAVFRKTLNDALNGKTGVKPLLDACKTFNVPAYFAEQQKKFKTEYPTKIVVTFVEAKPARAGQIIKTDEKGNAWTNKEGEWETTVPLNTPTRNSAS
jgi:hypothetical protein